MKFAYLIEPPFNFLKDDGRVSGCDVELARHVCSELGTEKFDPVETEFAELLPGVARGDWRMTTGLFATPEREQTASFTRPIWALPDGLLVKKHNPLSLTGYQSVADNPACTLAVIRDQFQHRSAVEFGISDAHIQVFETYNEAAKAVESGQADAYASVARAHSGYLLQSPLTCLDVVTVPASEKEPSFGCFAFSKSDKEFGDAVNAILQAYTGSSGHRKMMAGFGFNDAEIDLLVDQK